MFLFDSIEWSARLKGKAATQIHLILCDAATRPATPVQLATAMVRRPGPRGAKVLNLSRPTERCSAAYTPRTMSAIQNVSGGAQGAFHELGKFEDIIQDGRLRPAEAVYGSAKRRCCEDCDPPFDVANPAL